MQTQRLTDRLTQYWGLLKKDEEMPAFGKFNSAALDDVWDYCVMLTVNKSASESKSYTFYRMGSKVKEIYGEDFTGSSATAKHKGFKGATIIKRMDEVVQNHEPVYDSGQFINNNNKIVKFRSCLLPFGTNSEVTHVIAGISWREF